MLVMDNIKAVLVLDRLREEYPGIAGYRLLRAIRYVDSSLTGDETWDEYSILITKHLSAHPERVSELPSRQKAARQ